jgi:8-oxo-dGTP pyrophosphatase MutT (NUDIX family)
VKDTTIVEARPAASVLLLRQGPDGLQVFMVVRHHRIDFASGATVFPGGKVATGDRRAIVRERADGADGLDDDALALRTAAIRESFEECGLLLARAKAESALLAAARVAGLEHYREPLHRDETEIGAMLEAEDLVLACDRLIPFSHWITPDFVPKRFDTWFFVAEAPSGQAGLHDGREAVDSLWIEPRRAMAEADDGTRKIVFATRAQLYRLAESGTVAEALASAKSRPTPAITPWLEQREGGAVLRVPPEAECPIDEIPLDVAQGGRPARG